MFLVDFHNTTNLMQVPPGFQHYFEFMLPGSMRYHLNPCQRAEYEDCGC